LQFLEVLSRFHVVVREGELLSVWQLELLPAPGALQVADEKVGAGIVFDFERLVDDPKVPSSCKLPRMPENEGFVFEKGRKRSKMSLATGINVAFWERAFEVRGL